jgi:TRAP-type mannitol/chloroaromatic compound transport system substrate-binding protein
LDSTADLRGARVHVTGLARDVVGALGAAPVVALEATDIKGALSGGRLDAAEWLGPLAAVSSDLQPLAERIYQPGLNRAGVVLALNVRRALWDSMGDADRAIFAACAAEEYHLSLAETQAQALIAGQVVAPAKWPVRHPLSRGLLAALEQEAADVVARLAAADAQTRRIGDSYQAFRALSGDPPVG